MERIGGGSTPLVIPVPLSRCTQVHCTPGVWGVWTSTVSLTGKCKVLRSLGFEPVTVDPFPRPVGVSGEVPVRSVPPDTLFRRPVGDGYGGTNRSSLRRYVLSQR